MSTSGRDDKVVAMPGPLFHGKAAPIPQQLCRLDQETSLRRVKDGMNAAFRLYPVDRSKGAPYLARFWRDVGYRNCLLTHAPRQTEVPWRFCLPNHEGTKRDVATLPSSSARRGAPRSHHRTWVNQDGAKPHQRSIFFSLVVTQMKCFFSESP